MFPGGKGTILFLLCFLRAALLAGSPGGGISPGAEDVPRYLPLLEGRRVAVATNHTGLVAGRPLVDTLLSLGVDIRLVFSPEHGFRGVADAGGLVADSVDAATGIPVKSLYGKSRKPTLADLAEIDIILFDLQDVGVRFYTYISTLHYIMEAAAESGLPVVVLDRPNPNGHYIDGPVLDSSCRSFVGMHTIPVVYGMTIGEVARLIDGEGWLADGRHCDLRVVPCRGYAHDSLYRLPVPPSPNLPDMAAVRLYPSLCFFEGTAVSVGRGTAAPFHGFGHPALAGFPHRFTPEPRPGATRPKLEGRECFGRDLSSTPLARGAEGRLRLDWLIEAYNILGNNFFNDYFRLLAGTPQLRSQIEAGMSPDEIRESWKPGIEEFMPIRARYLIYP